MFWTSEGLQSHSDRPLLAGSRGRAFLAMLLFSGLTAAIASAGEVQLRPSVQNGPRGVLGFQSAEERTSLLELYTSEGCSSCPPAESWVSRFKDSPGLWKQFVPVVFHVDYFDHLGWRDPWGKKAFSHRQQAFAESWRTASVYTPGFILNGKEVQDWSVLKKGLPAPAQKPGVLRIASSDLTRWQVEFSPLGASEKSYRINAVLLASGLVSDVKSGENRGRQLTHDFTVIQMTNKVALTVGGAARGEIVLHRMSTAKNGRSALAMWVTAAGKMEPIQATGGWLPEPEKLTRATR